MRPRLALALSGLAVSALLVAGCGVSEGDEDSSSDTPTTTAAAEETTTTEAEETTTTEADVERSPEAEAAIESMVEVYTGFGFTEDEATCLAEGVADLAGDDFEDFDPTDTTAIMDVINECDIPISKLSDLGGSTDGTMEGGFKLGLKSSLEQQGLTEEQAQCVADGYVEQFGMDVSASQDADKMVPLFQDCGAA